MEDGFKTNLSLLCSYHRSVAEICRQLKINRQQFNKYLSGQTRPSRSNMRRICDFFGVTEAELLLEPGDFEDLIVLRRKPVQNAELRKPLQHLERLYRESQNLDKYRGYYFRYFYSFGNTGLIMRSVASITREDGKYYWKNIEILRDPDTGVAFDLSKYAGVVFNLADRIQILEYETMECGSITQATLYPRHRPRVDRLVGIQTGGPTGRGRKPAAARVVLEYLGRDVDLRSALKRAGLFHPDGGRIRPETLELLENVIAPDSCVLEVDEP
ncbi:helix-turn-helix domain-containing protein [Roseovarius salinarum]|uniref:helix-turn-helix domain-containing protein n=1 Tax=Roseovarius salinarum TaxID=1981892 RepID=UPI000C335800|nr:helix-turn-helix transcriptional regulator [Roseovarius salinarum]